MKHLLQRAICMSLSAVLGMCAPLPVTASDITDDYERLIQYEKVLAGGLMENTADEGREKRQEEQHIERQKAEESEDNQGEKSTGKQEEKGRKQQEEKAGGKDSVSAPSAILMETSTGQVIYEKNPDKKRPPASVTKVMTLLLIFDALDEGKIKLEDEVTTSEYAASMGGSQVFLEPGETQTVDTMIKCISVASANDACVAFNNRRRETADSSVEFIAGKGYTVDSH